MRLFKPNICKLAEAGNITALAAATRDRDQGIRLEATRALVGLLRSSRAGREALSADARASDVVTDVRVVEALVGALEADGLPAEARALIMEPLLRFSDEAASFGTERRTAERARAALVHMGAESLDGLRAALEAGGLTSSVIRVAHGLGHPIGTAVLTAALRDPHTSVNDRRSAATALGDTGATDATDVLFAVSSEDPDARVRMAAAEALAHLGDPRAVGGLVAALSTESADTRRRAARALGELGDLSAVGPVLAALADEQYGVQREAAKALETLTSTGIGPLLTALGAEDAVIRREAAKALGTHDDRSAVNPLLGALQDPDPGVRAAAATALGTLGDARAVDALLAPLDDEDPDLRQRAAVALGKLGDRRGVDVLLASMAGGGERIDTVTIRLLGELGDPRAVPRLSEIVLLSTEELRRYAITDAAADAEDYDEMQDYEIRSAREGWVGSRTPRFSFKQVRCEALDALKRIGGPEANHAVKSWRRKSAAHLEDWESMKGSWNRGVEPV